MANSQPPQNATTAGRRSGRVRPGEFRVDVPADRHGRQAGSGGEAGYLSVEEQNILAATPGVRRVDFLRSQNLLLDPLRPPVTLLARNSSRLICVLPNSLSEGDS